MLMKTVVLLVDDEEQFVDTLAQRLRTRGFDVDVASNGDDAISYVEAHDVDVVVLDVLMPGRDGIETLREMKHHQPKCGGNDADRPRVGQFSDYRDETWRLRLSHEADRYS